MDKLNTDKKTLRKFGITMGVVFLFIAIVIFIRHKHSEILILITSLIFFIASGVAPILLKAVYIAWMRFAFILGWVNTRLILVIIFYLAFAPLGLIMRLFCKDLLDRQIDKQKESYWKKKETNALDYQRQF